MAQQANPIMPEYIKRLRALGQEEVAEHLEHAYLLIRSQRDALGDIITHAAETLQTEGIADWGDGGEPGDTLIYIKDTVEEQYNNTKDLEREFGGPHDEVVVRRKKERYDLVINFLDYLEVQRGLVLAVHARPASAQEGAEAALLPATRTAEELVADFFAQIE